MAGPDFPTIGAQIAYWEQHITKRFLGGWSGSGENGVDIGLPQGTPVYALVGGHIVGHGYYGGGGVVAIEDTPGTVWYYQHLDLLEPSIESGQGQWVGAGQLIGWSGGQLSGGNHPSDSKYSDGPHIEVGINAPWGGIWGPMADKGANVDPWPAIAKVGREGNYATTGTAVEPNPSQGNRPGIHINYPGGSFDVNWPDPLAGLRDSFGTLWTWLSDPLRILKLVGGLLILVAAGGLTLFSLTSKAAPEALEVAGLASGQPELVAAGRAAKGARSGNAKPAAREFAKARRRRARSREGSASTTNASPSSPTADRGGETPPTRAKEEKGEPVYMDGKRVGTSRGGKITMDKAS